VSVSVGARLPATLRSDGALTGRGYNNPELKQSASSVVEHFNATIYTVEPRQRDGHYSPLTYAQSRPAALS
jgi:hypothetical protein